jgi:hypothetical protein
METTLFLVEGTHRQSCDDVTPQKLTRKSLVVRIRWMHGCVDHCRAMWHGGDWDWGETWAACEAATSMLARKQNTLLQANGFVNNFVIVVM